MEPGYISMTGTPDFTRKIFDAFFNFHGLAESLEHQHVHVQHTPGVSVIHLPAARQSEQDVCLM